MKKRKPYRKPAGFPLVCQWEECGQPFIGYRKGAMFCSDACQYAHYARHKMLDSGEVISCRLCRKPVAYMHLKQHFLEVHKIKLGAKVL